MTHEKQIELIKNNWEMLCYDVLTIKQIELLKELIEYKKLEAIKKILIEMQDNNKLNSEDTFLDWISEKLINIKKMNNKIEDEKILTTEIKKAVAKTEENNLLADKLTEEIFTPEEIFTSEKKEIIKEDTEERDYETFQEVQDRLRNEALEKHRTFIIDFETGGLNAYTDAICSVAITEKSNNLLNIPNQADIMTFYMEPQRGKLYGQGAFDVNGLTLGYLEEMGEQKEMVCLKIKQLLGTSCTLIGHNVEFDLKFLMQLFKECKAKLPIIHYIDTLAMAKKHLTKRTKTNNGEVENFKLTTLYNYYFNDFNEDLAHTADYDVFMTEKLYFELMRLEK